MGRRGLALIIVVGVLGVLAVLAAAFVAMAQLERRASEQRVNGARAYLLARSGIEDALARLELGQDPAYGGEDWLGDGDQGPGSFDRQQEVYQRGVLNVADCPARHALRPSFFARDGFATPRPALQQVDRRLRGYTGRFSERHAYVLKIASCQAGIHVNGGDLGRDVSMEGPNGFLVRLLNNLEAVLTNGTASDLGVRIVGARPMGGYRTLEGLPAPFKPYLSLHAWVDPTVIKPQPMDGRPARWEDIDDAHRAGAATDVLAGIGRDPAVDTYPATTWTSEATGLRLSLFGGVSGLGTEQSPWVQMVTATNKYERVRTYPVRWERDFIYAWSQLRPAPPAFEPRAPLAVNLASGEALAACLLGLKGATLEVWDGTAGWDAGFGWCTGLPGGLQNEAPVPPQGVYDYPSEAADLTPWHRTRVDYGMTYGTSARPWYGPKNYVPHAAPRQGGGKPVVQAAPLGRLRETRPVDLGQALAAAGEAKRRIAEAGLLRTWRQFNAFVDALPLWEDVDDDGDLDGKAYLVAQGDAGAYTRRRYRREDGNSDGLMSRQAFVRLAGTWALGACVWKDPGLSRSGVEAGGEAPGLTRFQKDVLKAMANPNTDLNDFNPDANLFKEVDKTDLLDHTTELCLDEASGPVRVQALGRVLGNQGRLLASRQAGALVALGRIHRDTTQADFMRGEEQPFSAPATAYGLSGKQALVGYPEPRTLPPGGYDGQIGLGFIASAPGPKESLRGDLFDTVDAEATTDLAVPDLRGPFRHPLLRPAGDGTGNVFPDGVYSEKDRTLRFSVADNLKGEFYVACWAKPNWLPEASPRAHALVALSEGNGRFGANDDWVPVDDIRAKPAGLYFAPARNNFWQDAMGVFVHYATSTRGATFPRRCLIWGTVHDFFVSDCLNRRGIERPLLARPMGRLEGRRWQHLAMFGTGIDANTDTGVTVCKLILGRKLASLDGGGWMFGAYTSPSTTHVADSTAVPPMAGTGSPNHLRFGALAAEHNMNYAADATFANVRAGSKQAIFLINPAQPVNQEFFTGPGGPAVQGRYLKEGGAAYQSPKLPAGIRPLRITWTEIPCDLWFDPDNDGWAEGPLNDRFGAGGLPVPDGRRDVRIDLEAWDDTGRIAVFDDPAGENRVPAPAGRLYYKAVFVNAWDAATRSNTPLDVTPFLDDVTVTVLDPRILAWGFDDAD